VGKIKVKKLHSNVKEILNLSALIFALDSRIHSLRNCTTFPEALEVGCGAYC